MHDCLFSGAKWFIQVFYVHIIILWSSWLPQNIATDYINWHTRRLLYNTFYLGRRQVLPTEPFSVDTLTMRITVLPQVSTWRRHILSIWSCVEQCLIWAASRPKRFLLRLARTQTHSKLLRSQVATALADDDRTRSIEVNAEEMYPCNTVYVTWQE